MEPSQLCKCTVVYCYYIVTQTMHHHTVQVAQECSEVYIYANGWKEKHHQLKLQWVIITMCISGVRVSVIMEGNAPPVQVAKGQD